MRQFFTKRSSYRFLAATLGLIVLGAVSSHAADSDGDLDIVQVRPDFYMISGAGANIGAQIGSDGIILVNSGTAANADKVSAALKKLTPLPIRYVINTNADGDFVGANGKLAKTGQTIFINLLGGGGLANATANGGGAAILAHDSILQRMSAPSGKEPPFPTEDWPTEAFYPNRQTMRMNNQAIEVMHEPAAHSDADSFVFFRASDVVVAGDVIDTTRFPVIDVAHGGSIQGEIDALNKLIELAVPPTPFIYRGVGTYVIPGHGRLCEQMEIVDYRDMVVVIRDTIADLIKQGKSLDQIKEASPAKPYETQYGSKTGPWTTSMFVEAVYKSLTANKAK
ncbi:MAG TPA: MBL fold metallo-hydrolase [Bryobacteraceae bacterium]|nr:MBL fold metallo-hydrolase [Bryobacteraceae bacterium]